MKRVVLYTLLFICSIIFGNSFVLASNNQSMTVEVDLIGFNTSSSDEIGIEVPDYVDLGELTNSKKTSSEEGIWINNTGRIDLRVTPILNDPDEEIFKYLYFRKQQQTSTNNTDLITFKKIGDYYLDINKPGVGKTYSKEHCYLQLDLTDFTGIINEDVDNYRTDVVFLATAR